MVDDNQLTNTNSEEYDIEEEAIVEDLILKPERFVEIFWA